MRNYLAKLILAIKMANYERIRKRREPQRAAYREWASEYDTVTEQSRPALLEKYSKLERRPVISVIMPVYNAPLEWLDAAIESVRSQIYKEWELCIADDCSTQANVRPYLEAKSKEEPRLKLKFRPNNGHISAASNSAIELASGEFLALMDQDDLIPENALLEIAICINENPQAQLIYTDEDKIDENGNRESPTRKQSWHPNMLDELNRISHLAVYKTDLVKLKNGFRVGYEGAQDHDLAIRCTDDLPSNEIIHIPKILYHWRSHQNSTAQVRLSKPYATIARKAIVKDRLRKRNKGVRL